MSTFSLTSCIWGNFEETYVTYQARICRLVQLHFHERIQNNVLFNKKCRLLSITQVNKMQTYSFSLDAYVLTLQFVQLNCSKKLGDLTNSVSDATQWRALCFLSTPSDLTWYQYEKLPSVDRFLYIYAPCFANKLCRNICTLILSIQRYRFIR